MLEIRKWKLTPALRVEGEGLMSDILRRTISPMDMGGEKGQAEKCESWGLSSVAGADGSSHEFLPCQLLLIKTSQTNAVFLHQPLLPCQGPRSPCYSCQESRKFPVELIVLFTSWDFWAQIMLFTVLRKNQAELENNVSVRGKKLSLDDSRHLVFKECFFSFRDS